MLYKCIKTIGTATNKEVGWRDIGIYDRNTYRIQQKSRLLDESSDKDNWTYTGNIVVAACALTFQHVLSGCGIYDSAVGVVSDNRHDK